MELTRRQFGSLLGAAGAALLTGTLRLARGVGPVRTVRALRTRLFPGRLRRLTADEVRTPGRWAG